jgi:hypothetical protein
MLHNFIRRTQDYEDEYDESDSDDDDEDEEEDVDDDEEDADAGGDYSFIPNKTSVECMERWYCTGHVGRLPS